MKREHNFWVFHEFVSLQLVVRIFIDTQKTD
jgi:hypothetical protein